MSHLLLPAPGAAATPDGCRPRPVLPVAGPASGADGGRTGRARLLGPAPLLGKVPEAGAAAVAVCGVVAGLGVPVAAAPLPRCVDLNPARPAFLAQRLLKRARFCSSGASAAAAAAGRPSGWACAGPAAACASAACRAASAGAASAAAAAAAAAACWLSQAASASG